jgi:anti-sigma B factor antagonist
MSREPVLQVYEAGPTTVVGFCGEEILDEISLANCRSEIIDLLKKNDCKVLAFDLTGVTFIPSSLLGLLSSVRQMGVEVHLYNPSPDVQEVLSVTHLDRVMPIHFIDVDRKTS